MQFIYILTLSEKFQYPAHWTNEENQTLDKHFLYLKGLFESGVMKHVGRTDLNYGDDNLNGYAIFESESEELAREIMQNDPAVQGGIMSAKLLPYKIVFHQ